MEDVFYHNPFLDGRKGIDGSRLYVTFLEREPDREKIHNLASISFSPDELVIRGREVYLFIPVAYGKSKLSKNLIENRLQVVATTRNWKTVGKLVELSSVY